MNPQNQNQQLAGLIQRWQIPAGLILPSMLAANTKSAKGDMYFVNGNGIFQRLAIGSSGQLLTVSNGQPAWGDTAGYSGTVTLAKLTTGGTNGSITYVDGRATAYTAPT